MARASVRQSSRYLSRLGVLAGVELDLAEMQQADGFALAIADLTKEPECLFFGGARAVRIAEGKAGHRQGRERRGDVERIAQPPAQRKAVLEHQARLVVVALAHGEGGADVQRVSLCHFRFPHRG